MWTHVFLVFLYLQANAEMVPKFQVATACFWCRIKITSCCECRWYVFQIIDKTFKNSKFRCLSEATPYHHNVITFTLFLPEGRTGVAWEPSNRMMLFLPSSENKVSVTSSLDLIFESTLHLSFPTLPLSPALRSQLSSEHDNELQHRAYITATIRALPCEVSFSSWFLPDFLRK
jgi:hypothetical protein